MFLAMVYARDGTRRIGLEDAILRASKDVAAVDDVGSDTRHVEEEVWKKAREKRTWSC